MIGSLGLLVVLGLIAVVVAVVVRAAGGAPGAGDTQTVRRFFQYLLLYALFVITASGLAGLLGRVVDPGEVLLSDQAELALFVTFAVAGGLIFAALAWWSRRRLAAEPREAGSVGWAFYLTAAGLTSLVVAMTALHEVLSWAIGLEELRPRAMSRLAVWGLAWGAHWWLEQRAAPPGRLRAHHLLGSAITLVTATVGLAMLVAASLRALLGSGAETLVAAGSRAVLAGAVTTVVGALPWLVYWRRGTRIPDRLWLAYLMLLGVGGGLVTAIGSASAALYAVAVWLVGDPSAATVREHFAGAPAMLAGVVVGLLLWWYHRSLLEAHEPAERTEARRVYEYAMSGVGLVATSVGVTIIVVAVLQALTGGGLLISASAVNTLLGALTTIAVGAPVWWVFWSRIRRAVGADPAAETSSVTRKVYLRVLFGIGGVAAVIALLTGVYLVLEAVFSGEFGTETVRSTRFAVAVLLTTAAVSSYHWTVHRADETQAPPVPQQPAGPGVLVLVGPADPMIAAELQRRTGARVQLLTRTDAARGWSADEVTAALAGHPHDQALVLAEPDGVRVIPISGA